MFELKHYKTFNTRTVYSIWDFLGDVGGLFDMLARLGGLLAAAISRLSGSGLSMYLITSLFKIETT